MLTYRALARIAVPLVPLVRRDPRQRKAHRARLAAPGDLATWARERRDPSRPLMWFHASSVGEGLQARAVIRSLRSELPDIQLVYTHFSPSAESFAATVAADWNGYLCYDRRGDVDRMLAAAAADLLVFTKLDLWPTLAVRAAERGTRVAMIAGTVSPASGRLRWPARPLARAGYAALDLVVAIAAEDAERLARLGCRPDRVVVAGDPRVDSVLQAADQQGPSDAIDFGVAPQHVMVAGSTWPADEAVVLPAFAAVRDRFPEARLIVAPHDPTELHLQTVDMLARDAGLPGPVRLSAVLPGTPPAIVIVDRVGLLARLYRSGGMAYVGGGFGGQGIHSVLEPAAASRPVLIGPRDRGSRDAGLLAAAGALTRLQSAAPAEELAALWSAWLEHPDRAERAGQAARQALESECGAAARTARLLAELLAEPRSLTARTPVRD